MYQLEANTIMEETQRRRYEELQQKQTIMEQEETQQLQWKI